MRPGPSKQQIALAWMPLTVSVSEEFLAFAGKTLCRIPRYGASVPKLRGLGLAVILRVITRNITRNYGTV